MKNFSPNQNLHSTHTTAYNFSGGNQTNGGHLDNKMYNNNNPQGNTANTFGAHGTFKSNFIPGNFKTGMSGGGPIKATALTSNNNDFM